MLTLLLLLLGLPQEKPQALKFAWPERIEAVVESERSKEQREGSTTKKKSAVKARYRMQVEPHAKGRLIRYTQYELLEPRVTDVPAQEVAQLLGSLSPSVVVTNEGEFAGVEDIATLKAMLEKMVAPLRAEAAGSGLEELLKGLTSEAFLASTSQQEWDGLVGNWVGSELTSEVLRFEGGAPMPLFPDMEIVLKGTMRMVERSACKRGGTEVPCATFELTSSADQKSVEAVLERMLRGAKGMEGVKYERFDTQTVVRVTLETATMLPHNFTMTKTVNMSASKAGQGRFEGSQIEARTSKYTYLTPPGAR